MALKQGEGGFFERRDRARAAPRQDRAFFERGGVEIFEIRDQLVDGRVGQLDAGLGDVPADFSAGIE